MCVAKQLPCPQRFWVGIDIDDTAVGLNWRNTESVDGEGAGFVYRIETATLVIGKIPLLVVLANDFITKVLLFIC